MKLFVLIIAIILVSFIAPAKTVYAFDPLSALHDSYKTYQNEKKRASKMHNRNKVNADKMKLSHKNDINSIVKDLRSGKIDQAESNKRIAKVYQGAKESNVDIYNRALKRISR